MLPPPSLHHGQIINKSTKNKINIYFQKKKLTTGKEV